MTEHDQSQAGDVASHDLADQGEWLTLTEARDRFSVSESTLRRALSKGQVEGAVTRKGPKGDYWLLPARSLEALGYTPKADSESVERDRGEERLTVELEALRERLAEKDKAHEELLAAERRAHAAEVERLTKEAEYERQLRESAETAANLAATLAAASREELLLARAKVLELESPGARKRWWSRKPKAPTEPPPSSTGAVTDTTSTA